MSINTHAGARTSRRRPRAATTTAALVATSAALLFSAAAAPAAVTTGPVDAGSGFPFSYADTVGGFALEQCQDDSGFCLETPRPDPTQPISVPDNYTADEEGFWWLADATVPNAGTGLARFAKESAFDTPGINQGHQVSFSRIRFRFQGLVTGATYRVTHPYGVDEIEAEADPKGGGRINFTNDVGCIAPPCGDFPALAGDPITAFLRWDPTVNPQAPAGYIGNGVTPHAVIGSPANTNFVRLERLLPQPAPPAPPVPPQLIGETSQFVVQGKLAGPPPAPAPNLGLSATSIDFGSRQVGSPSSVRTVTVSNHGTAAMNLGTVALTGADTGDFAMQDDTCSGQAIAAGASCTVGVRFAPAHTGDLAASLSVASDAPGNPHAVALSGIGTGAGGPGPGLGGGSTGGGSTTTTIVTSAIPVVGRPAPAVAVLGTVASPLSVRSLSLPSRISITRLRLQGLRLSMQLPGGSKVVRIAIYRTRNGKRQGRAVASVLRLPDASGRYTVRLRSRSLLRGLRPGQYVAEVSAGRGLDDRGAIARVAFTVTR
jgi:hypothetical protein